VPLYILVVAHDRSRGALESCSALVGGCPGRDRFSYQSSCGAAEECEVRCLSSCIAKEGLKAISRGRRSDE
jgi:hypothetical protein